MHVACEPIDTPMLLVKHRYVDQEGEHVVMKILIVQTGLLDEPTLAILRETLGDD